MKSKLATGGSPPMIPRMSEGAEDWFEKERLHFAAGDGDLKQIRLLLAKGYGVNAFDSLSYTPLHYAAKNNHIDAARYLIGAGADVNAHDERKIGTTALRLIVENCSLEMARLFIEAGADPTIPGSMGTTALQKASGRKRGDGPSVYALLLAASKRFGRKS